jgi:3-oxoacyl-[acyl-carrier-protein] synthase II
VTAPKSFFGHLGAGCGALELAASLVGMSAGEIPLTLNYEQPDRQCPVNVVREPVQSEKRAALKLSSSRLGHAAAIIMAGD